MRGRSYLECYFMLLPIAVLFTIVMVFANGLPWKGFAFFSLVLSTLFLPLVPAALWWALS